MSSNDRVVCVYCGPGNIRPNGYDRLGTPYECLRKGVGVGKFSERRRWQYQTGQPVDPPYNSPCPRVADNIRIRRSRMRQNNGRRLLRTRSRINRSNRSRSRRRSIRNSRSHNRRRRR